MTESVARSRAPHFYPTPSGSHSLFRTHPRSSETPLSPRRTFPTPFSRTYGIRKNVPRSFPLSAISFPCRFNPSRFPSSPLIPPLSFSFSPLFLVLSCFFIILSSSSYAHVVRSVSSRKITLSSSLSSFPLSPRHPIRTYPPSCSYPCLIPPHPVHARASNTECHAYPFCVRAIDARGKLSLVPSFHGDPAFSLSISFDELRP